MRWFIKGAAILLAGLAVFLPAAKSPAAGVKIRLMGASALVPLMRAVIPAYRLEHPWAELSLAPGGSYAGLVQVRRGGIEVGMSDLPASRLAAARGLAVVSLGCIPVAVVAHPGTGVASLRKEALRALFSGAIRDWRDVGGPPRRVVVVTRQIGSGSRAVMEDALGIRRFSPDAVVQLSNGAVVRTVLDTPGALGYVDAGYLRPPLVPLGVGNAPWGGRGWPLEARASLVLRQDAAIPVRQFVNFVLKWPSKARFGIASKCTATEETKE